MSKVFMKSYVDKWNGGLSWLAYSIALLFLLAAYNCSGYGQMRMAGFLLVGTAIILQFNRVSSVKVEGGIPLEVKLFVCWVVWSLVTGLFVVRSWPYYLHNARILIQAAPMVLSFYAIICKKRDMRLVYVVILFSAFLLILFILGHFSSLALATASAGADEMMTTSHGYTDELGGEGRVTVVGRNANAVAFVYLAAIWAAMMLYRENVLKLPKSLKFLLALSIMFVMSYFVLQTGSRKGVMVCGIILGGWLVFVIPGRIKVTTVLIQILMAIIVCILAVVLIQYVMNDTYVGKRFAEWFDSGGGSAVVGFQENVRGQMYKMGFEWWIKNPIFGLGLGQFAYLNPWGFYSHSDYIEPLANTGLVGFILYQGYAFIPVCRILRLLTKKISDDEKYKLKGMLVFFIGNHYLIGIGCPHCFSHAHLCLVSFCSAYTYRVWREYLLHRRMMRTW